VALADDLNASTKENEKLSCYKDLETEVSRMWKVRTKIVPIIIGALGTIKKGLYQNLLLLPAIELQKIKLMSTAYSIRKVLE
jgi:hypothetical protein